jgi:hypothetical protein
MKVSDWINDQLKLRSIDDAIYEAQKRWPYRYVRDKKGPMSPGVLQRRIFKLNKQIKKEAGISSYYPLVLMVRADLMIFFFNNEQEKAAAENYIENDSDFELK